jgi:hypothetical protein
MMRVRKQHGMEQVVNLEEAVTVRKEGSNPRSRTAHRSVRHVASSTTVCTELEVTKNVEGWAIRLVIVESSGLVSNVVRKVT